MGRSLGDGGIVHRGNATLTKGTLHSTIHDTLFPLLHIAYYGLDLTYIRLF